MAPARRRSDEHLVCLGNHQRGNSLGGTEGQSLQDMQDLYYSVGFMAIGLLVV